MRKSINIMYTLDRNLFFFEFYENCDEKIKEGPDSFRSALEHNH